MVDIKEVVKEMCNKFAGGRSGLAGALGMTTQTFNNKFYEKNGCRFFEVHELEAMEDLCGEPILAKYFANRAGGSFVKLPDVEDLDSVELFSLTVSADAKKAMVSLDIAKALEDGEIDEREHKTILAHNNEFMAAKMVEIFTLLNLYKKG